MVNYTISTFNSEKLPEGYRFYILSRGKNTGRPSYGPNPNCWVVSCNTEQDRAILYAMCNVLHFTNYLEPYLRGSVIPFVPLHEYKGILRTQLAQASSDFWEKAGVINKTLLDIETMIANQQQQKKLFTDIRQVTLAKYLS